MQFHAPQTGSPTRPDTTAPVRSTPPTDPPLRGDHSAPETEYEDIPNGPDGAPRPPCRDYHPTNS